MARPRSDIRPRIIESARKRFLTDGVDGASLRGIAQAAGTNIGMVYYYFPTKDDLFLGVVEDIYAGLLDDMASAVDPSHSVENRIERLYRRFAAITTEEFDVVRILIREVLSSSDRMGRILERFQRGHIPLVLGVFAQGQAQGVIDGRYPLPIAVLGGGLLGAVPQLLYRLVRLHAPQYAAVFPGPESLAEFMLSVFWNGLRARQEGPRTPGPRPPKTR